MKIKLLEPLGVSQAQIDALAQPLVDQGHEFEYFNEKTSDEKELIRRSQDADILMIANNPLPASVVESAQNLQMISVAFTGVDHVPVEVLNQKGILLSNAAGYSDDSVAELVIGLTLDLMRNVSIGNERTRKQGTISGLIGQEIRNKTVGIVGTGRIGCKTAMLFQAFGAKVVAYSRTEKESVKAMGINYVDIETLMSTSDIISLHMPLNNETKGMINKDLLSLMKASAYLINCARGPVMDNKALADLLNTDKIKGAGIDVFDMEPPIPQEYPLLHAKNTVLTPHVAYATDESMIRRAEITFNNVLAYLEGQPINVMR